MTVLVLPMSWCSKIAGVNILENHHCCNSITWLRRIAFILIFVIFYYYFFVIFCALLRDVCVSYFGYH